jgi:hypothetical protein
MAYVEIDLNVFADEDIRDEAIYRGLFNDPDDLETELKQLITKLYEKRRLGKDYQSELDKIIYDSIGKII